MKVFVSWSGQRSKGLALALREWLPLVLHYVEPWLSEADVSAGDRWAQEVAKELEASNFGIICVTPENLTEPWILFEAGALAKSMNGGRVIPLLFSLEFSDISGPLAQFQAKKFSREGLGEVIQSINLASDGGVPKERATQLFQALWPQLEGSLAAVPTEAPTERHTRPQHEIIEELVAGVRGLDSRLGDVVGIVSEGMPRHPRHFMREFHPMMFEELAMMVSDEPGDPIVLLLWAGMLRDELPWLAELLTETYRDFRTSDQGKRSRSLQRLTKLLHNLERGPIRELMHPRSKYMHRLLRELPMMLDHTLHRIGIRDLSSPSDDTDTGGADES